jgi:acetoacetyl-CoA reductase
LASLAGRTAVVTGASRGIGRATARLLAANGAQLALCYHERVEDAETLRNELAASGADVLLIRGELADPETPARIVAEAFAHFGQLDCLVNNAGVNRDGRVTDLSRSAYDDVLAVNFLAAADLACEAANKMIAAGFGRIVNVASFVAHTGVFGAANYAAAKSALITWTKSAALEWARHGITVNVVSPGYIETDMLATIPPDVLERIVKRIPLRRFGSVDDVAAAIVFALAADYMTGSEIAVNGGVHM